MIGQLPKRRLTSAAFFLKVELFSTLRMAKTLDVNVALVLCVSADRPDGAGESGARNRTFLKPPSEVVSNLPGFVLDSCGRLKPTETANHDVIAPPPSIL